LCAGNEPVGKPDDDALPMAVVQLPGRLYALPQQGRFYQAFAALQSAHEDR
jgi:hypothetical protein